MHRPTDPITSPIRAPVLVSLNRSSPAVRSTSSQRSVAISLLRHPVSINIRIAATAGGHGEPFASASHNIRPIRRYSSLFKNRSR